MVDSSQRVALVLGGCGNVGSGVVGGFIRLGYGKVAVISRDIARLSDLRTQLGAFADRLVCILGDIGSEAGAVAACQEVLNQCQKVDDIVSAIGFSWWQKGLVRDQSKYELESTLNSLVVAPFVAYKTFIQLVKDNPNGSYTFVTGGGADMYLAPKTGFLAVGGAALQGLARSVLKEHMSDPVCVTEVCINLGITPVPDQMPPELTWLFNQDAGDAISSVAIKKQGRGKTNFIYSLDDLRKLKENGRL